MLPEHISSELQSLVESILLKCEKIVELERLERIEADRKMYIYVQDAKVLYAMAADKDIDKEQSGDYEYFSLAQYAEINGLKCSGTGRHLGRKATDICRSLGIVPKTVLDKKNKSKTPKYLNTYPEFVLEQLDWSKLPDESVDF